MKYQYAQITSGYRWNISQRIKDEIGLDIIGVQDSSVDGVWYTFILLDRELTNTEKTSLDNLMANNPSQPPAGTCRFKIDDLWEKLQQFNQASGTNFRLYYSESVPGSGIIDTLELHASAPLTTTQKNKVKTAFSSILKEV